MGKKDSNNQLEAWRKKEKQKERKRVQETRKDLFEEKIKGTNFDDAVEEVERLRELKEQGKLTFEGKHKLQRHEKYLALYAPELKKRQKEAVVQTEEDKRQAALEKQKRIARFSVFYHPTDNPFGIAPPGEKQQYRWPDGSVRDEAPYEDEDAEAKRQRLEKTMYNVPGFSKGMLAKLAADAAEAEEKEQAAQGQAVPAEDEPLLYIPPLPTEPYPFYEAPPPPPQSSLPFMFSVGANGDSNSAAKLLTDVTDALDLLREDMLRDRDARKGKGKKGKDGKGDAKGKGGKGGKKGEAPDGGDADDTKSDGEGSRREEGGDIKSKDSTLEDDIVIRTKESPTSSPKSGPGKAAATSTKDGKLNMQFMRAQMLRRNTANNTYAQAQLQVSSAATSSNAAKVVATEVPTIDEEEREKTAAERAMDRFLADIEDD